MSSQPARSRLHDWGVTFSGVAKNLNQGVRGVAKNLNDRVRGVAQNLEEKCSGQHHGIINLTPRPPGNVQALTDNDDTSAGFHTPRSLSAASSLTSEHSPLLLQESAHDPSINEQAVEARQASTSNSRRTAPPREPHPRMRQAITAYDRFLSRFHTDRENVGKDLRRRARRGAVRVAAVRAFISGCDIMFTNSGRRMSSTAGSADQIAGYIGAAFTANATPMPTLLHFSFIISRRYGRKLPLELLLKFVFAAFLCGLFVAFLESTPAVQKGVLNIKVKQGATPPLCVAFFFGTILCFAMNRLYPKKLVNVKSHLVQALYLYLTEVVRFTRSHLQDLHREVHPLSKEELLKWFWKEAALSTVRSITPFIRDTLFLEIQRITRMPPELMIFVDEMLRFYLVFERIGNYAGANFLPNNWHDWLRSAWEMFSQQRVVLRELNPSES